MGRWVKTGFDMFFLPFHHLFYKIQNRTAENIVYNPPRREIFNAFT
jgi:hypothetical protein